jgi:tetratricopeptide (TPR) repeat protein
MEALYLLEGQDDPRVMGRLCIDIGNAFSMLGPELKDETTEWYQRAIDRLLAAGDWAEVARAYLNLGVTAGEKNPEEGLEHLYRAREYAEKGHEPRWVGWALVMGIELRLAVGQVEEAERDNQQATRLLERMDDPLGLQQATMNAGLINERRGQWEEAEVAYRRAVERAEKLSLGPEVAECEFHLARLFYKTRDIPRAREAFLRAKARNLPALKPVYVAAFAELGRQIEAASGLGNSPA